MTFLRRHWPDLVIVLLILALVAGFAVVLLGRGGEQARQRVDPPAQDARATPAPPADTTAEVKPPAPDPDIPRAPGETAPADESAVPAPTTTRTPDATPVVPGVGAAQQPPAATPARPDPARTEPTTDVEELPTISAPSEPPAGASGDTNTTTGAATPTSPQTSREDAPAAPEPARTEPVQAEPEPTVPAPTAPTPTEPEAPKPAPAAPPENAPAPPAVTGTPSAAVSARRTPTRADYRISTGIFNDEAEARQRTRAIASLGYTVHVIPIANGNVVAQVGPFADRETAARATAQIQGVYPAATVYAPAPDAAPAPQDPPATTTRQTAPPSPAPAAPAAPTPAPQARPTTTPAPTATAPTATSPATPAPTAPAPAAPAASAPVPDVPVYLQVGAFDRQESATPFVEQLRAQGFAATVNAPPGRKVRVLIGPFGGDALLSTEARLRELGVDSFRVR